MKKSFYFLSLVFISFTFFSSCKKCGTCTFGSVETAETCGSTSYYNDTKSACESSGGTWTQK